MQTTLRLDERLYAPQPAPRRRRRLPVSSATGGLAPGFSTLKDALLAADLTNDRLNARRTP